MCIKHIKLDHGIAFMGNGYGINTEGHIMHFVFVFMSSQTDMVSHRRSHAT